MISSKARKQRKRLFNAPMHKRQKLMAAGLPSKLRKEYGRRSLGLRVGDKIEVKRGDFAGTKGKIIGVDLKSYRVRIDTVKRRKNDGTEVRIPIHPSNIMITEPTMTDKKRAKIIERSGGKVTVTKEVKEEKKTDEKKQEAGFKCQVCKKALESQTELNKHMTEKHKDYTIGE